MLRIMHVNLLLLAAPPLLGAAVPSTTSGDAARKAAVVSNGVKEADLTSIRLEPKAESRLGIKVAPVKEEHVQQSRIYGGEVVVPKGRAITVAAPVTGTVSGAASGEFPGPGMPVTKGQPILRLKPVVATEREVLTPAERISLSQAQLSLAQTRADLETARVQAEGEQAAAKVELAAAKVKLDRNEALRERKVGSEKAVDEAQAEYDLAEAKLKSAQAKLEVLKKVIVDLNEESPATLTVTSPLNGLVKDVYVTTSQPVAGGAPICEVIGVNPIWVRVPVYVGDLRQIDPKRPVRVRGLADPVGSPTRVARPVASPPSGNPLASTVDLFFDIDNKDGALRPGQRLAAIVPLGGSEKRRTAPWSAVLHDVHGGTWVYENTGPHVFVRRRVEVSRVVNGRAILARGPKVGAQIVITGAAELFSIEFGVGK